MSETRNRLLDATRNCIGQNGLAATTSRDITSRAEVNLAAITYHFGSKDQLVAEALLETLRDWLRPTLQVLAGGGDPSTRAVTAIHTLVATFDAHRNDAPAFLQALVQAPRMESVQAGLAELWDELRELLSGDMTEMQRRNELAGWVEPAAMATLLIAVANGLVLQLAVDPGAPPLDEMATQFGALLLAARDPGAPSHPEPARRSVRGGRSKKR